MRPSRIAINIVTAQPAGEYRLHLTFNDGMKQTVDFKPFLTHARHPDIRAYLDPGRFQLEHSCPQRSRRLIGTNLGQHHAGPSA